MPLVGIAKSPRIGLESAGIRMTPEEFEAIEDFDEEYRYELVNGVLVVNAMPLPAESGPNELLGYLLNSYGYQHPQGSALDATLQERYIRTPDSLRRADRVIWTGLGRLPNRHLDVPRIAVELVSEGKRNWNRDYVLKRAEYAAAGVEEYWIIDRFARRMTVFRASADGSVETILQENETYATPLLPGFVLNVSQILISADKWSATE